MPKRLQRRRGIHLAGGVIGAVDQNCLGLWGQSGLNTIEIKIKLLISGNDLGDPAMIIHIKVVLDKKGGQDNHLVTGIKQGFHHHVQTAGRATGHQDITLGQGNILLR